MVVHYIKQRLTGAAFSNLECGFTPESGVTDKLKIAIWTTLATGSIAIVSAIFKRGVMQETSFSPYIFQGSLASCAICAAIAAFIIYKDFILYQAGPKKTADEWTRVNTQVALLEKRILAVSAMGLIAAIAARDFIKITPAVSFVADYAIHPLISTGITAIVMRALHS